MIDPTRIIGEFLRATVASPASTTLNGGITAAALTINVVSGAAFASYEPPQVYKIDSEFVIGVRASNAITIDTGMRGALGSTAASHLTGAMISLANLSTIAPTIMPDRLPTAFANLSPVIQYRVRGGAGPDVLLPTWEGSIEFLIYGGTKNYDDAVAVARALHDRFHDVTNQTTASGTIMSAVEEVAAQDVTEPDTEWPRVFTAYAVTLRR